MGEVARWIRATPGAIVTEGVIRFSEKSGYFRIFALQIYGLPPGLRFAWPSPLINEGGKNTFFVSGVTGRIL